MDDGVEREGGPGDAVAVPPRQDAWVRRDQPCELIDFSPPTAAGQGVRWPCGVHFRVGTDAERDSGTALDN